MTDLDDDHGDSSTFVRILGYVSDTAMQFGQGTAIGRIPFSETTVAKPKTRTGTGFFNSLTSKQQASLATIAKSFGERPRSLADYHAAGQEFLSLQIALNRYRSDWMGQVLTALADKRNFGNRSVTLSRSLAYRLAKFGKEFGTDEVAKLDGKINWETVMRLLAVAKTKRAAMLRKITKRTKAGSREPPLSTREVRAQIQRELPYRRPRWQREVPRPSTNPNQAVRQLRRLVEQWKSTCEAWIGPGDTVYDRAVRVRGEYISDHLLDDLKIAEEGIDHVAATVGKMARAVAGVERRLRSRGRASS